MSLLRSLKFLSSRAQFGTFLMRNQPLMLETTEAEPISEIQSNWDVAE